MWATNGFGAAAGVVGAGSVGCIGAVAGDNSDKVVVVEYKRETSIVSEKDKRDWILIILEFC